MKIYITADMEGASGITNSLHCSPKASGYERGCQLLTGDVKAAIEGALQAGAKEVLVNDSHGPMTNIRIEDLPGESRLISGSNKPLLQMQGIDASFDAAFFVAYHAREGTPTGLLNHTIAGNVIQEIRCNGKPVGETAINAGIAGYFDVPVLLLTGDDQVALEAESLLPGIETVVVKHAIDRHTAECIPPRRTEEMIRAAAARVLADTKRVKPYRVKSPVTFDITFRSTAAAAMTCLFPMVERTDGKSIRITHDDYLQAFKMLWGSLVLAMSALGGVLEK